MRARLRSLAKLAASLTVALVLVGCVSPAPPDGDGGTGDGGQGQGGDGTVVADWDTLLAGLPDATLESFWSYREAVLAALREAYAEDPRVVVSFEAPPEDTPPDIHLFNPVWRRYAQENHQGVNPLDAAAAARVQFHLEAAEGDAPGLAGVISGEEDVRWSSAEDVDATREVVTRMWQAMSRGFCPVGTGFWEAFTALHQAGARGNLAEAGGRFLLPGPAGFDTSLSFRAYAEEDRCSDYVVVNYLPEGAFPSEAEDWATATSAMPQAGLLPGLESYADATVSTLRRVWAGQDVVVAQTGAISPTAAVDKWEQTTLTWLRFPVEEDDPGCVLETLTVRLTPASAGAVPLATTATVTELVAWDPESYSTPQDFQALVPARDLFLKSYLSIGDDFLEAFDGLQLTPGLTQELPGLDGSTIRLTVEEMTQEDAALRVRYTLAYAGS